MERVNAREEILKDQESFDNWVAAEGGDRAKIAADLVGDIFNQDMAGEYLIDDETKMVGISKVVGFYWSMV
jgi:hypothetical protein